MTAPLPCGRPDPAHVALARLDDAGARYARAWSAAHGDPALMAAADATFAAALDAIGADIDEATAAAGGAR